MQWAQHVLAIGLPCSAPVSLLSSAPAEHATGDGALEMIGDYRRTPYVFVSLWT